MEVYIIENEFGNLIKFEKHDKHDKDIMKYYFAGGQWEYDDNISKESFDIYLKDALDIYYGIK